MSSSSARARRRRAPRPWRPPPGRRAGCWSRAGPRAAEQRERGLRAGRLGDVVGDGGPVGDRRDVEALAGVLEDADDAGRSLVGRLLQVEPVDQVGLGGGAGDGDRPGVRGVGEQRTQRDDELGPEVVAGGEQLGAELPPAHAGLDAADQDHVAVQVRRRGDRDLGRGPGRCGGAHARRCRRGAVDLEVVEVLGVDRADHRGVPDADQVVDHRGGGVGGVVPALEGGDHDGVDQVRHVLDLDHVPASASLRTSTISSHGGGVSRCGNSVHVAGRLPRLTGGPDGRTRREEHRARSRPTGRHRTARGAPARAHPGDRRRHGDRDPARPPGRGRLPRRAVRRLAQRPSGQRRPADPDPAAHHRRDPPRLPRGRCRPHRDQHLHRHTPSRWPTTAWRTSPTRSTSPRPDWPARPATRSRL